MGSSTSKMARPTLRYELESFLIDDATFGLKRATLFRRSDNLLKLYASVNKRIQPRGLESIFYARFRTTKQLWLDESVILPQKISMIHAPQCILTVERLTAHLQDINEEELKKRFADSIITGRPVYFASVFSDNHAIRERFEQFEKEVYLRVQQGRKPLIDQFAMYNRESLTYCRRHLEPDIKRLERLPTRFKLFFKKIGIQAGIGAGLSTAIVSAVIRQYFS